MLINNKKFELYLSNEVLHRRVTELAHQIEVDYFDKNPLFLGILTGCFIFVADLLREISFSAEVSFIKLSSYKGMKSTGRVTRSMNLETLEGRNIIIVEDIVDSGTTLNYFLDEIKASNPASVEIATLLFKKDALKHPLDLKYIGFEIPDKFVIGYGLDFDGEGRNLKDIFQLSHDEH
jgi:hypoxanthine phosphoribosyltransferase